MGALPRPIRAESRLSRASLDLTIQKRKLTPLPHRPGCLHDPNLIIS